MAMTVLVTTLVVSVFFVVMAVARNTSRARRGRSTTHEHVWSGSHASIFEDSGTSSECSTADSGGADCGGGDGGGGGSD